MTPAFDLIVVGGGLVGLSTAFQAIKANPNIRLAVLEKENVVSLHQSSRNSGVLHAGLYYPPGSLKARLCVAGKIEVEEFAERHDIQIERNGKLVVAVDQSELSYLDTIFDHACANGVVGAKKVSQAEMREIEPAVQGLAAIHSPTTAVLDFSAVARALANEITKRGGLVVTGAEVNAIRERTDAVVVSSTAGDFESLQLITCGGLQSDRLAAMTHGRSPVSIVPFKGSWYALSSRANSLCRGNIYPVPDPGAPFLGVHVSRRIDGSVWVGPNATLAGSRERYDGRPDLRDLKGIVASRGFRKFARRNVSVGLREMLDDRSRRFYLGRVRKYLPDVERVDLEEKHMGIRAQAISRDGSLVEDFLIHGKGRVAHVLNAPSPAATSCLAIGRHVLRQIGTSQ